MLFIVIRVLNTSCSKKAENNTIVYNLQLCPGSVSDFINLTEEHVMPCFDYKMPVRFKEDDHLSLIKKYENLFESQQYNNRDIPVIRRYDTPFDF